MIIIKKRGGLCTGTACIMNTELLATSTSVKSIIIKRGLSIYKPGTPFVVTYKRIRSENERRKGIPCYPIRVYYIKSTIYVVNFIGNNKNV